MEMLREQKADRDEVLDGLRDKADTSRLAGLLSELDFAEARTDFERRIDLCHEKFDRQDEVWQVSYLMMYVRRPHICHRWCGGSHTLVTEFTRRAQAPAGQLAGLARKFQGYGADGRLYMMEEECQPCVECNLLSEEETLQVLPAPPGHGGAGDMSPGREPPLECTCPLTD
ncbi:jg3209 [Pararge aegeria aegeria]|uniref:Jg3209 protein n=1 Tax=Pararge aegeria aegeria TaxID=348720 RepID=A0A8S4RSZ0_9NEOP|nr:jg3209 [Pararge aegeria aegeria]